jgi:hypothetical protein
MWHTNKIETSTGGTLTNQQITPPPKLAARWKDKWFDAKIKHINLEDYILAQAAQWGADQELEACVDFVQYEADWNTAEKLRAARRPKPLSLKEKALKALKVLPTPEGQVTLDITDLNTIRRALEQLPEAKPTPSLKEPTPIETVCYYDDPENLPYFVGN